MRKLSAAAMPLVLLSFVAVAGTVLTRDDQRQLSAEAQKLHNTASQIEIALNRGEGRALVEDPLLAAINHWDALPYTDVVKSAFDGCKQANVDLLSLATSLRSAQRWANFEALKRKHISEDMEMCVQELTYPRRSLIEATEDYGVIVK